jgi:hypothetical protein
VVGISNWFHLCQKEKKKEKKKRKKKKRKEKLYSELEFLWGSFLEIRRTLTPLTGGPTRFVSCDASVLL